MNGILDYLEGNWQQLLGISPAEAAPAQQRAPTPLPPFQGSQEASLGPGRGAPSPQSLGLLPDPGSQFSPGQQPPMSGSAFNPPPPQSGVPGGGPPLNFDARAQPVISDLQNDVSRPMGANAYSRDGTPVDFRARPPTPAPGTPNGAPVQTADASGGRSFNIPSSGALPPPASAMNLGGPPVMTNTSGGLMSSLGLNPANMQVALSGLGRGLSAVGAQPAGTSAGRSFAAGAGGGLTGGIAEQNQQFNQKSQAFKDWIAGEQLGNQTLIDKARAQYFMGFGKGGTSGPGGIDPAQRMANNLEQLVLRQSDQWRKTNEAKHALLAKTGMDPDALQKIVEQDDKDLQTRTDAYRTERAKRAGIDPDEYKRGTSPDIPFEGKSPQHIAALPDDAWYRYKDPANPDGNLSKAKPGAKNDGYTYKQRDYLQQPPYPGWQPSPPQGQQAQAGPSPLEVMMQ